MENKKLVPQIRFKGFHDEWKIDLANNLFKTINEKNYPNLPILAATQEYGMVTRDSIKYDINFNINNKKTYKKVSKGQFVIHLRSFQGGFAHSSINGITSPAYTVFDFKDNNHSDLFWKYIFSSNSFIQKLEFITYGIRDGRSINFSEFCELKFIFPRKIEQISVSNFITKCNTLISKKHMKLEKIKALKQTLLKKMFPNNNENVPEIRFKGFTENWEKKKLGNIGSTYNGLTGKSKDDFGHGNALYIPYLNIFNNPIIDNSKLEPIEIDFKQNKVLYGDIFFTTSSETPEEVGMSSVWLYNYDNIYLNSFCFGYRLKNINEYNLLFFTYLLRSLSVRKKIAILAQGISRYNISKTKLMNLKIKFPNKVEQEKIGTYFYKLDKLISLYEKEIEKLTNLKKAFLKKMFV